MDTARPAPPENRAGGTLPPSPQPKASESTTRRPANPDPQPATQARVERQPEPRPEIKVKPPEFWEYEVRAGESLQTISRNFYGKPDYATAIARANPLMDPTKLKVGKVIRIPRDPSNIQGLPLTDAKPAPEEPPRAKSAAPKPGPAAAQAAPARRAHRVVEGDTLSGISKKYYGSSGKAGLIYEANKDKLKSEDDLRIGVELVVPDVPEKKGT